jgi:uncharacterized protein YeaO (DUF488 family)
MIKIKRIYEGVDRSDGVRLLVDRLWPRGLSKDKAKVDVWLKDIAPSDELRNWFGHEPEKWNEFRRRYFEELKDKKELVGMIIEKARSGAVTLLYGAKDERYNNAVALKEFIETQKV